MAGQFNTFETGLAVGTAITGANSGSGQAGTAFGANFYQSSGASLTYSSTAMHGSLAARAELTSSSGLSIGFAPPAGQQQLWTRGYFYYGAVPNANTLIHFVRDGAVTNSGFGVRVTTAGVMQLREHVNYTALASIGLEAGKWYRLELYTSIDGSWRVWLYEADIDTPIMEHAGSVSSTAASQLNTVRWGVEGSGLTALWYFDDIAWSDEGKIGLPVVESSRPTRYVYDGDEWLAVKRDVKT